VYATITNIMAYLPFPLVTGSTGDFLFSLPIVMTVSLVASRLVSMTFLPLLGYYLLRPENKDEKSMEEQRKSGFLGLYARAVRYSIEHRWKFFIASLVFLAGGILIFSRLNTAFFPEDVQYWSYIDVWLPNDANLGATNETALKAEKIVREQAARFYREHGHQPKQDNLLRYITTFVGGGGLDERAQLSDVQDLCVYGSQDNNKVKLAQISDIDHNLVNGRIVRLEQFRTINIRSFPIAGHLSSEVLKAAMPRLRALEATLPPGYKIQIGGEYDKTKNGFRNLAVVMLISIVAIFMALAFQFKNAITPILVLAAAPYGMIGAFAALWIMGEPFGFMAFLGVASLVGVIVSHSIVLFDFIEERGIAGDDFELALIDAGILRLRPVLITVFATVLALVPLAIHGGPLWKPLCYAQIGGLLVATIVTKLQVPVMYAIFVVDLKVLKWDTAHEKSSVRTANT
jgi:multidrug efflux pump subunit AcrB